MLRGLETRVCARVARPVLLRGPSASPLGCRLEHVVNITFAPHVGADEMATWLTTLGACGIVRPVEQHDRQYVVTVRRSGAKEYLETILARGESLAVLSWQAAAR